MYKIVNKRVLNPTVTSMDIYAPLVAKKAEAGQFIILRVNKDGERIPLTVAGYDRAAGTVKIIFQIVGGTTMLLNAKREGDYIEISKTGNRKKLKSYFIDKKVPRQLRDSIWLLADQSHVLWIIGYRISEGYKIGKSTKYAVKAEMKWR